ncbi:hypothetical protein, partial [Nocardia testacea]|uniref:hypothetical protein n=1 Tax=Nocardia testacea TaxID=248551 RepID=UPI003570A736
MTVPSAMLNVANRPVVPVTCVVVGATFGHARHHRQHRLGTIQSLHLRFLVHTQNDNPLGW